MAIDDREISEPLRVVRVLRNGKRYFDRASKERLIDACLEPGVSIAGLALSHGINTNQLRKWVNQRQDRQAASKGLRVVTNCVAPSAFIPVVEAAPLARPPAPAARSTSPGVRLKASLPNGVRLELVDADAGALSAMIEALGRCNVPAG
ncbi:IS66-like element accessory protein TnpA [Ensifer sp. SL37]|uniref:IS66-like element accessory protein TnpA n=1 Tax=Ensifer sp. SL37 TaxID=2995137 RepID=UPI002276EF8E|nr:transposase [Ensifer sp. SL37]MCY1740680.1 transposase [Ensifer sp. SL37]MCY1740739.1 transposase [Ensifer sp. SL37]